MRLSYVCILFSFIIFGANGANILFLGALPSPSHDFWNNAINKALALRNHNVTVLSPGIENTPLNGLHFIQIENLYGEFHEKFTQELFEIPEKQMYAFTDVFGLMVSCDVICAEIVKSNGFKTLLNYPDDFRFDLVLYDFTIGPCLLPFLHKFKNPPLIAVTAFSHPSYLNQLVGGNQHYAYVPHNALEIDGEMTFRQRLYNFLLHIEEFFLRQYVLMPQLNKIMGKYFGPNMPSVAELEQRTKIALINTNPAFDYLAPLPENVIPVAGLHIKEPKPLSKDLENFFSSSNKGVVLFSLGSNFRSEHMTTRKQKLFIDVFSEFQDYNFLWKFESNITAAELPKNIQIRSWLPQSDILAHPKLKAFITHNGLLSTHEAIWRGVPIIGMPFGMDQNKNLARAKLLGFAEGLDSLTLTKKEIRKKLFQVLEDPKYAANAKKLSAHFKDQKELPLNRAVWWIEWVLRNPNADYMKSPVLRIGYIVGNSLDLIAFITLALVAILIIGYKVIVWSWRRVLRDDFHRRVKHNKFE